MSTHPRPAPNRRPTADLTRRRFLRAASAGAGALFLVGLGAAGAGDLVLPVSADETSFVGVVVDLLTDQPVRGAIVRADPLGTTTTTDGNGVYRLVLPAGTYSLGASAPGYVSLTYVEQKLVPGLASVVSFDLVREGLSPEEEDTAWEKLGLQVESPLPAPALLDPEVISGLSLEAAELPSTIRIRSSADPNVYSTVPLEDYVKGVVLSEVFPSWPMETLKAQAVAARSYGVAVYTARCRASANLCWLWDNHWHQTYNPSKRTASTDAAVDATRGVVMTYAGNVATALYFRTCNNHGTLNSENAVTFDEDTQQCVSAGFSKLEYCRAKSCGGHGVHDGPCGYSGHGVGMCQYGARARGQQGLGYQDILRSYYTSIDIVPMGGPAVPTLLSPGNGALFMPNEPITLRWSGAGSGYWVYVSGRDRFFISGSDATSCTVTFGSLGTYEWYVEAAAANGQYLRSETRTIRIISQVFRTYMPTSFR